MNRLQGVQGLDPLAVTPVAAPLAALLLVLLVDAVAPGAAGPRWPRRLHDAIALAGLLAAGAAVVRLAADGADVRTACVPGGGLALSACSFVVSPLTLTLQGITLAAAAVCLLLALDGPVVGRSADRAPHHVLLLAAVAGATALAGARDLATLVVALETATLPAVGLVALRRDPQGAQGAVTFLLTAITSLGLLLLGVGALVAATGSAHLERVAAALAEPALPPAARAVAVLGVVLAVAGVAFKLSAVPFHLWTPDTYAGAPLPVAAFLAAVSKTAGAGAAVVLLAVGVAPLAPAWTPVVGVLAALTLTVGNLVALRQRLAVRLLAWSTVAQAGWVLLPLAGAGGTPAQARAAAAGAVGYLAAYVPATLAVFAVVVVLARHHRAGEEHALEAYRGLARREPVAAAVLAFGLACLAGLPPGVVGLVAKIVAVRPVVDAAAWPLALVAAANVALGLVYYLRWAALLLAPGGANGPEPPTWRVRPGEGLALGAAAAACLVLSVWPQAVAGVLPGVLR